MKLCNQCGRCCLKYGGGAGLGMASSDDLLIWELERPDILDYVYSADLPDIWIDPVIGEEMDSCPWLKGNCDNKIYSCAIDDVRPTVCRNYPVDIEQMRKDGCEMLEQSDVNKSDSELMIVLNLLKRCGNNCE